MVTGLAPLPPKKFKFQLMFLWFFLLLSNSCLPSITSLWLLVQQRMMVSVLNRNSTKVAILIFLKIKKHHWCTADTAQISCQQHSTPLTLPQCTSALVCKDWYSSFTLFLNTGFCQTTGLDGSVTHSWDEITVLTWTVETEIRYNTLMHQFSLADRLWV